MNLKKVFFTFLLTTLFTAANASLVIHHKEGSAPIAKFDLKVMSLDGRTCYERKGISEFTQQVKLHDEDLLACGPQEQFIVYGILPGYYADGIYYGDKAIKHGGECTISHEKDGYVWTKLLVKCSD